MYSVDTQYPSQDAISGPFLTDSAGNRAFFSNKGNKVKLQ